MDAAVDFDGEAKFVAVEVEDEAVDRVLAAEFEAEEAPVAEVVPKGLFGGGLRFPKCARCRDVVDVSLWRLAAHDW